MAFDINSVLLVGRLTRDVDLSYLPNNNTPIAKFSIANNTGKDEKSVNYFDVTAWDKLAEVCSQFLKKGSQVVIQGRLQQQRFQDKTGQNRSKVEITATNVQFVGGRQNGMDSMGAGNPPTSPPSNSGYRDNFGPQNVSNQGGSQKAASEDPFDSIDFNGPDEEIPF